MMTGGLDSLDTLESRLLRVETGQNPRPNKIELVEVEL